MLTEVKYNTRNWGEVDRLISGWLKDRQKLIVLYCKVDGIKQFTEHNTPISVRVHALCDVLIDYVSAGHFEIYKHLMQEAAEFQEDYQSTITRTLPLIQQSTELALDFNDRYCNEEISEKDLTDLSKDLNELGLKMVERFDLEDRLIDKLHNCHRDMVA